MKTDNPMFYNAKWLCAVVEGRDFQTRAALFEFVSSREAWSPDYMRKLIKLACDPDRNAPELGVSPIRCDYRDNHWKTGNMCPHLLEAHQERMGPILEGLTQSQADNVTSTRDYIEQKQHTVEELTALHQAIGLQITQAIEDSDTT